MYNSNKLNNKILKNLINNQILYIISIISIAVLYRLIPHPYNFSPLYSLALFSGYKLNNKTALITILLAMIISDYQLGFYNTMVFNYLSFGLIIFIGSLFIKNINIKNVLLASITSSLVFYLISNFGVWLLSELYTKNTAGLYQCYYLAIPFLQNSFLSTIFYNIIIFGIHYIVTKEVAHDSRTIRRKNLNL